MSVQKKNGEENVKNDVVNNGKRKKICNERLR